MSDALLAPVPCVHLYSALNLAQQGSFVAFGTNARGTFVNPSADPNDLHEDDHRVFEGTPVYIYPSRPELGNPGGLFKGPYVVAQATFVRWQQANKRGKHALGPHIRPESTLVPIVGDSEWDGFWEVAELKLLDVPKKLQCLHSRITKAKFKVGFKPERPMLIEAPDL